MTTQQTGIESGEWHEDQTCDWCGHHGDCVATREEDHGVLWACEDCDED